jgi:hypothetical protein
MINIQNEMSNFSKEELKTLGRKIMEELRENNDFNLIPSKEELQKISIFATNQIFPYPLEENKDVAFQLTPEQIYFRARFLQECFILAGKKS